MAADTTENAAAATADGTSTPHGDNGRTDVAGQGQGTDGSKRRRTTKDESAAAQDAAGEPVSHRGKKRVAQDPTAGTPIPTDKKSKTYTTPNDKPKQS